jgi:hypothetical protein
LEHGTNEAGDDPTKGTNVRMWIIPRSTASDPLLAFVLSAVGGVLIFLDSVVALSNVATPLDAFGVIAGGIIVGAAMSFRSRVTHRKEMGGLILGLSFLSFFGYSGYFLGSVLGVIGGALALAARGGSFTLRRSSTFTTESLGPPCPHCGRGIPTWTSKCPYCGYPE